MRSDVFAKALKYFELERIAPVCATTGRQSSLRFSLPTMGPKSFGA